MPKTQRWRDIVEKIGYFTGEEETLIPALTNQTLKKTRFLFKELGEDPGFLKINQFLLKFSMAFQHNNPEKYLAELGINNLKDISLIKIARAIKGYKEDTAGSSEFRTIANQAATDAIQIWFKKNLDSGIDLFDEELNKEKIFRKARIPGEYSEISRIFFAKITERYLKYFLEREASGQVQNLKTRIAFNEAIEEHIEQVARHAFETAKITQSYSAGWYTKHAKGKEPNEREITKHVTYAMKKLASELEREGEGWDLQRSTY